MTITNEKSFASYSALKSSDLKVTTQKALNKMWTDHLNRLEIPFQRDSEGNFADVGQLGTSYLAEHFIWTGLYLGEDEVTPTVTLGELAESREAESDLVQFEVQPTRVEKILTGTKDGLVKGHKLMQLIEVVYLPGSNQFIIGGGRHRTVALLTLVKGIEGWEDFEVPVLAYQAKTIGEVAAYIQASNGSRSMSTTEKAMVDFAGSGTALTVFSDAEDFFVKAKKERTVSGLKKLARLAGASLLRETVVDRDTKLNTMGDIANSYFGKLCRELNDRYGKGTDKIMLAESEDGQQVFEAVLTEGMNLLVNNWEDVLEEIKEVKTLRGGGIATDENGEPIYTCNIARKSTSIAEYLVESVVEKVGPFLAEMRKGQIAEEQAQKAEKAAHSKVKQLQNMLQNFEAIAAMGVTLTPEQKAEMQRIQEEIDSQLSGEGDTSSVKRQPTAQVNAQVNDLLG